MLRDSVYFTTLKSLDYNVVMTFRFNNNNNNNRPTSLSLVHFSSHCTALHFISFLVLYCFDVQCIIVCLAFWFLVIWLQVESIKLNLNLKNTRYWTVLNWQHIPWYQTSDQSLRVGSRHRSGGCGTWQLTRVSLIWRLSTHGVDTDLGAWHT